MEGFINKLIELAKGTGRNIKRGLDGTAMEEMRQAERKRNEKLINRAHPGGVPGYMRDTQATSTATSTMPMKGKRMEPSTDDYRREFRRFNKPK